MHFISYVWVCISPLKTVSIVRYSWLLKKSWCYRCRDPKNAFKNWVVDKRLTSLWLIPAPFLLYGHHGSWFSLTSFHLSTTLWPEGSLFGGGREFIWRGGGDHRWNMYNGLQNAKLIYGRFMIVPVYLKFFQQSELCLLRWTERQRRQQQQDRATNLLQFQACSFAYINYTVCPFCQQNTKKNCVGSYFC